MSEPTLPPGLVEARRTPLFDVESLRDELAESHRTTVWAQLFVQSGSVRYTDLEGDTPREVGLGPDGTAVIEPGIEHRVEPSTDATFFIQSYGAGTDGSWFGSDRLTPPLGTVGASWTRPRHHRRSPRNGHAPVRRRRPGRPPRAVPARHR